MQTTAVAVCSLDLFGERVEHFWIGKLSDLSYQYPILQSPHKQDFYALVFVEKAIGKIVVDSHEIALDCTKAIIIKPGCISSITLDKQAKGKILCFTEGFFSLRYNANILQKFTLLKMTLKHSIRLDSKQQEHWIKILDLLEEEFRLQHRETAKVLRSYLNIILFEAERIFNPMGSVPSNKYKDDRLERFEEMIGRYFVTQKSPSSYADMLSISPNYLNKLCKETWGQTAGGVIRKKIIIEARRLLHYTNFSVNEIADQMGFNSASYFITFFKKYNGKTPEKFRVDRS